MPSTCRRVPGSRYAARDRPVRLARLHPAPFTDRLVAKFDLPVQGWRGSAERRRRAEGAEDLMLEEIRIGQLGVIESSRLELGPGLTVITGETGAGKTMVVTALGLLLGGRADSGMVRTGAGTARVEGVVDATALDGFAGGGRRRRRRGRGRPRGARPQRLELRGGRGPGSAAPRCRCPGWPTPPSRWWPCTASPTSTGCCRQRAQREALDRFGGEPVLALVAAYTALHARLEATERELDEVVASARERAREADLLRFGLGEIEAVDPKPGEDAQLAADEARLGYADALRTAAEQAREALSSEAGDPDALGSLRRTHPARRRARARPRGRGAGRPAGRDHLPALRPGRRRRVLRRRHRRRPGPAGRGSERRAALTALTRKYGETVEEVLAWAEASPRGCSTSTAPMSAIEALRGRAGARCAPARRGRADAVRRPHRGGGAGSSDEVTAELSLLAMPHARLAIAVTQHEAPSADGDPAPAAAAPGRHPLAAAHRRAASTRSSSCSPPTPAPSRDRCTRAPPAASCPG